MTHYRARSLVGSLQPSHALALFYHVLAIVGYLCSIPKSISVRLASNYTAFEEKVEPIQLIAPHSRH